MAKYVYNDVKYKLYGFVNQGVVARSVTDNKKYHSVLYEFLHNALGVMNYTCYDNNLIVHYELERKESSFIITINWVATQLKSETISTYLSEIKNGHKIQEVKQHWKNSIAGSLLNLHTTCVNVTFYREPAVGKHFDVTLFAEITNEKLDAIFENSDREDPYFDIFLKKLDIPWEERNELLDKAAALYDSVDNEAYINTLRQLEGKDFCFDYFIGEYYYRRLNFPNKAYPYFKRALKYGGDQFFEIAPEIYDFLGSIELYHKYNREEAERYFLIAINLGYTEGLLKLAFKYLCDSDKNKKKNALILTEKAEPFLADDEDNSHRLGGFHIAASVYLWNDRFEDAAGCHHHFFQDAAWCVENENQVESYLLLVLAKDSDRLFRKIISDYPVMESHFNYMIKTWYYCILHPEEEGLESYMTGLMNKINGAIASYR